MPLGLGALERQRRRRRRRLEPDREEHDLAVGVLARDPQRVERRVDHPHVGALAPWRRAACAPSPGTRSMSPKQVKITPSLCATAIPSSTRPIGITHTGQPGPWTSSTFGAAGRRSRTCRSSACGRRRPPSPCSGGRGRASARISPASARPSSASRNSSTNFTTCTLLGAALESRSRRRRGRADGRRSRPARRGRSRPRDRSPVVDRGMRAARASSSTTASGFPRRRR